MALVLVLIGILLVAGLGVAAYLWSGKHSLFTGGRAKRSEVAEVARGVMERVIQRIEARVNPRDPMGTSTDPEEQWNNAHWLAPTDASAPEAIRSYVAQMWCDYLGAADTATLQHPCPDGQAARSHIFAVRRDSSGQPEFGEVDYQIDIVSPYINPTPYDAATNPGGSSDANFFVSGINLNKNDSTDDWAHRLVVQVTAWNTRTVQKLGDSADKEHKVRARVTQDFLLLAESPFVTSLYTMFANHISPHALHSGQIRGIVSQWYDTSRLADWKANAVWSGTNAFNKANKHAYYQFGIVGFGLTMYNEPMLGIKQQFSGISGYGMDNFSGINQGFSTPPGFDSGESEILFPDASAQSPAHYRNMKIDALITRSPSYNGLVPAANNLNFTGYTLSPTMRRSDYSDPNAGSSDGLQILNKNIIAEADDPQLQPTVDQVSSFFTGAVKDGNGVTHYLPRPGVAQQLSDFFVNRGQPEGVLTYQCDPGYSDPGDIILKSYWDRSSATPNTSFHTVDPAVGIRGYSDAPLILNPTEHCRIVLDGTVFIDGDVMIGSNRDDPNAAKWQGRGNIMAARNIYITGSVITVNKAPAPSSGSETGDPAQDGQRAAKFDYRSYEQDNGAQDQIGLSAAGNMVIGNLTNSHDYAYIQTFTNAELNYFNVNLDDNDGDAKMPGHILADGRFGMKSDNTVDFGSGSSKNYQVLRGPCSQTTYTATCGSTAWPGLLPEGSDSETRGFTFYYTEADPTMDGYGFLRDVNTSGVSPRYMYNTSPQIYGFSSYTLSTIANSSDRQQGVQFGSKSWLDVTRFRQVAGSANSAGSCDTGSTLAGNNASSCDSLLPGEISNVRRIFAKLYAGGVITGLASWKDKVQLAANDKLRTSDAAFFDTDAAGSFCDSNNDGLQVYGGMYARLINVTSPRGLCVYNDNRDYGLGLVPIHLIKGREYKEVTE